MSRGRSPYQTTDAVAYGLPNPRLRPPLSLGDPEKRAFLDLVVACPATQFQACDIPLLTAWAEAVARRERAQGELAAGGMLVDGKPSPWLAIRDVAVREMALLAMRLRVGPQARADKAPKKMVAPVSYYDRMKLGDDDDDAPTAS